MDGCSRARPRRTHEARLTGIESHKASSPPHRAASSYEQPGSRDRGRLRMSELGRCQCSVSQSGRPPLRRARTPDAQHPCTAITRAPPLQDAPRAGAGPIRLESGGPVLLRLRLVRGGPASRSQPATVGTSELGSHDRIESDLGGRRRHAPSRMQFPRTQPRIRMEGLDDRRCAPSRARSSVVAATV